MEVWMKIYGVYGMKRTYGLISFLFCFLFSSMGVYYKVQAEGI